MPVAWLHIGAGKCGSSLIQGLLNEPDAVRIVGPQYQSHLSSVIQSHTPCFDYDDFHYQVGLNQIRDEIPEEDVLFSCENLNGVLSHRENCYEQSVKVIKHLFPKHDVKLLMFVRRQDTWIESLYGQDVKRQEMRDFPEYVEAIHLDNLHWLHACDAYAAEFDLTVLPFESFVLKTGGKENFATAVFDWLGKKVSIENLPVKNPSLSMAGIAVQMLANRLCDESVAYSLSFWLERYCAKKPEESLNMLGSKRAEILARYRDTNTELFRRYMPDFDASYYRGE